MSSKLNPYEVSKKIKTNINNINHFKNGIRKNTIRLREEEKILLDCVKKKKSLIVMLMNYLIVLKNLGIKIRSK